MRGEIPRKREENRYLKPQTGSRQLSTALIQLSVSFFPVAMITGSRVA